MDSVQGNGTITASIKMQTHVHTQIQKGNMLCFSDVSAGFYTGPHSYLLRKLQILGYRGKTLQWVKSYLSGGITQVKVETRMSKRVRTRRQIPHGGLSSPGFWRSNPDTKRE